MRWTLDRPGGSVTGSLKLLRFSIAAALLLSLVSCAKHDPPSLVGDYRAGSNIVLADGAHIVVPRGWSVHLFAPGARTGASGNPGAIAEVAAKPYWGTAILSVYGSRDAYQQQLDRWEKVYRLSRNADLSRAHFRTGRMELQRGHASVRSYVTTYSGQGQRDVYFAIERSAGEPLMIAIQLTRPPAAIARAGDSELPATLLDYLHFSDE